jgi:uncharacterized repeat protein (TIGR03803 family)
MLLVNSAKGIGVVLLMGAAAVIASHAQTFTTLVKFNGTNGANPLAGLVQGTDGSLYGTTDSGGTSSACGCGTIFKVTRAGALTTLHNFTGPDGAGPDGALIQASNGSFYGTTASGGASYGGYGTVFKITPAGTLTTLHSFDSTDGANPNAGLVQATDGSFYGTTTTGGANGDGGTIFRITPGGTLTTLHSFAGPGPDGAGPFALTQASNGSFYGTTGNGGTFDYFCNGCGTIFKITPAGAFTTLYSFTGGTGGYNPLAGLVQATNGSLYGTTAYGGISGDPALCQSGCGTIFSMTPGGTLTTLYTLCAEINCTDGAYPYAGLIQATDRNLYGTTLGGGVTGSSYTYGTVFKITPSGALTVLHSFDGTDGSFATAGLLQATDGNFYGTTYFGGLDLCSGFNGCGTVFSLSVGLGPFVKTLPTSGKVGASVKILGTNLTGATNVTFNGTAAAFTLLSPSLITTNVPTGATTGTVQAVTPGGTLSSNVAFLVRP